MGLKVPYETQGVYKTKFKEYIKSFDIILSCVRLYTKYDLNYTTSVGYDGTIAKSPSGTSFRR